MDNPYFRILAHPTGRLFGTRPASKLDLERVLRGARERNCFVELNAQPDRMDLNDAYCRLARDLQVKVAISTDAHSDLDLHNMRYGVDQARRGWLEAVDVLNTLPLTALEKTLKRR